ncbi:hypothetical protein V1264_008524 [Littorina saxatilis]|uniref:C1q domain-containing protein n=1 Tax=Littorina saxatilis TaxID=31220 RepID=A0AAN9G2U5_9CAEN
MMKYAALVKTLVVVVFLMEALVSGCDSSVSDVAFKARQDFVIGSSWLEACSSPFNFTRVDVNKGQGFNKDTSTFVVPVTGTYLFNIYFRPRKYIALNAYPVSLRVKEIQTPLTMTSHKPWSSSATLKLDKGKAVTVWPHSEGKFCNYLLDPGPVIFSGTLIHKP